jgi:hypothetical protein
MSTLIVMPDGNAVSPMLIKQVTLSKGRGILCRDAQQRNIAWIPVADEEKGERVRDILIRLAGDERRFTQPDWSFLDEEVAAD